MQRNILLACLWMACGFNPISTYAQGELEVFSELGEVFTLYVNQMKQNPTPSARVEVKDLQASYYHVRIDFEDATLPDFAQNNVGVENGVHSTYLVKLNRKGAYVLRMNSSGPILGQSQPALTQSMPPPPPPTNEAISTTQGGNMAIAAGNSEQESISMNINLGGGILDAAGALGSMNLQVTTTTTTTTAPSSSLNNQASWDEPANAPAASTPVEDYGFSNFEFNEYLDAIRNKTFEDSKLTTAKAPLSGTQITARQVAQVMGLFTFEDSRLEFAIFAHPRCLDPQNYYLVYDAFEFELSIDDLQEAIAE